MNNVLAVADYINMASDHVQIENWWPGSAFLVLVLKNLDWVTVLEVIIQYDFYSYNHLLHSGDSALQSRATVCSPHSLLCFKEAPLPLKQQFQALVSLNFFLSTTAWILLITSSLFLENPYSSDHKAFFWVYW